MPFESIANDYGLIGKVAIVSGAGGPIGQGLDEGVTNGRAAAILLARAGAKVDDGIGALEGRISGDLGPGEQREETREQRRRGGDPAQGRAHWITPSPATFTAR